MGNTLKTLAISLLVAGCAGGAPMTVQWGPVSDPGVTDRFRGLAARGQVPLEVAGQAGPRGPASAVLARGLRTPPWIPQASFVPGAGDRLRLKILFRVPPSVGQGNACHAGVPVNVPGSQAVVMAYCEGDRTRSAARAILADLEHLPPSALVGRLNSLMTRTIPPPPALVPEFL